MALTLPDIGEFVEDRTDLDLSSDLGIPEIVYVIKSGEKYAFNQFNTNGFEPDSMEAAGLATFIEKEHAQMYLDDKSERTVAGEIVEIRFEDAVVVALEKQKEHPKIKAVIFMVGPRIVFIHWIG
jgi:hypothetical protein